MCNYLNLRTFNSRAFLLALVISTSCAWAQAEETLRDPTTPLSFRADAPGKKEQQLILNSILISSSRKLAIINGQALHENDVIKGTGGAQVKTISPNQVVIQQNGKTWHLTLNTTSIRQ